MIEIKQLGEEVEIELGASGGDPRSKVLVNGKRLSCSSLVIRASAVGLTEVTLATYAGVVRMRGMMEPVDIEDSRRLEIATHSEKEVDLE